MKKLLIPILILFATSCASPPRNSVLVDSPSELPSIQSEKSELLSELEIGMPLSEFKQLVPEAYVAGQSNKTTAYEMVHIQKYVTRSDIDRQNLIWGAGSPNARTRKQVLWFYFYSNRLVQWGEPQDWPDRPDLILETRAR